MLRSSQINNIQWSKKQNFIDESEWLNFIPNTPPGNSSDKNVAKFGKKPFSLSISMIKGIRVNKFVSHNNIFSWYFDKCTLASNNTYTCRWKLKLLYYTWCCYSTEKKVATDQSIKNSVIHLGNKWLNYGH